MVTSKPHKEETAGKQGACHQQGDKDHGLAFVLKIHLTILR